MQWLVANLHAKIELDCEILKSIFIQKHEIFKNIHSINEFINHSKKLDTLKTIELTLLV